MPPSNRLKPTFSPDDELLASCQMVKDAPFSKSHTKRDVVSCQRFVAAADYSFHYSFESAKRVPTLAEMKALDDALIAKIEGWRCNK